MLLGTFGSLRGKRTVSFPSVIDGDYALMFTRPTGTPLRHSNFYPLLAPGRTQGRQDLIFTTCATPAIAARPMRARISAN